MTGYRQPEAGTTVLARGRGIGLLERPEQPRQLRRFDADAGVFDREAHEQAVARLVEQSGA